MPGDGARKDGQSPRVNCPALLAEYTSLRTEILKRIEFRHQLTAITLTAAAAFLGVGYSLGNPTIALILPLLIPFLAMSWVHNDLRVGDIAEYIRTHSEIKLPDMQWETRMHQTRGGGSGTRRWRRTVLAQAGVFGTIQLLAIAIGFFGTADRPPDLSPSRILVGLDAAMIVLMLVIMSMALLRYRRSS